MPKGLVLVHGTGADRRQWQPLIDHLGDRRPHRPAGRDRRADPGTASAHDQIIPPEQQQALLAGIEDARDAEIDAGHGAAAEDPAGFVAKRAGFLLTNSVGC